MGGVGLLIFSWFAAKARLPEKQVLDTAKETVRRFLEVWYRSETAEQIEESVRAPIQQLLEHIPLVKEVAHG